MILILLIFSFQSFSQDSTKVKRVEGGVFMPLDTYRGVRYKFYLCDTALANRDEKIFLQDSLYKAQGEKLKISEDLVAKKDTTISQLNKQLTTPKLKVSSPVVNVATLTSAFIGLIIGILLVR
jgi:hypothetical protein